MSSDLLNARILSAQNYLNQLRKSRLECMMAGVAKPEDYAALDAEIKRAQTELDGLMANV